jgi:hypothetical protein
MDTSESLSSDACVKTGVVIGIFSDEAFLPNMYLQVQPYKYFGITIYCVSTRKKQYIVFHIYSNG